MKHILGIVVGVGLLTGAQLAFAQTGDGSICPAQPGSLKEMMLYAICLLRLGIPLLVTAGVVFFLYGIVVFIFNSANPEKKAQGAQMMIWGIVGLFVMVSIWGLVQIFRSTFGFNGSADSVIIPQLQVPTATE
jgi:hypothetical protein